RQRVLSAAIERRIAEHDAAARARDAETRVKRTPVVPVHFQWQIPPLALGMIMAYAKAYEGGRLCQHYDFRPDWLTDTSRAVPACDGTPIYLFSHYVWSSAPNLARSEGVKAANPRCITVHGGPDVPKYEGDVEAYFRKHPHVDVAVHGEGEVTATALLGALVPALGDRRPDLSVLETVPGLF